MDYEIKPARYAKGKLIVCCPSPDGWKTRAGRLASAIAPYYTGREHGYSMSKRQADQFERLFAEGWDGSIFRALRRPASD